MNISREELRRRVGQRFRCRAIVARFGAKRGNVPTLLLINVTNTTTSTLLADHLWFTAGRWSANLRPGDTFEFDARATRYVKGYQGRRVVPEAPVMIAWRLERPTRVTILPKTTTNTNGDLPACTSSSQFTSNLAPTTRESIHEPSFLSSQTS